ncbi:MAG: aminoacyl-tRNA hydrolase [Candidatus Marinimicrobia bacterium]|jgi:PTH1 family peptidyl-tRNA hydrolase|nr:aminoacyl-tRNA hydrolase [Candidatus Neomarinimicrobiota bacterium]|tara:strand:+ start:9182 stop:9751 length:570 start_codon:yes stop_codon:yes gene_type:complete
MIIFVGLGNSESKYLSTKHNVGFWVMDKFAESHDMDFKPGKGNYIFAKKGSEFLLVKPTTGMNNSGSIIREVLNFYKAEIKNLVVVFDDVDLPLGEIRIKTDGGDGCHNGMKSILQALSTDQITRLKIGIAASDYRRPSEKYVLKPFNKKFHPLVEEVLVTANEAMLSILNKGTNETMNNFNKQNIGVA